MADRFGIGWRPELAAGILANLEHLDVLEVMADDLFDAPKNELRAFRRLPVVLHGVSLGLASTVKVDEKRLAKIARVLEGTQAECWSEHLAFVRGGGHEIGHLAAPPRNADTIEGTLRNLDRAREVTGQTPLVENIATLIEPPFSALDEREWLGRTLEQSSAGLLLDLHNLHANATNFGWSAESLFDRLPLERVRQVHLAGGRWIQSKSGERRLLDDHLHPVPDAVYRLLEQLAARVRGPLTVVLERDGRYPPFEVILAELKRAREAVEAGRVAAQLKRSA
ncbi:MAG: DUF692 domain-containing protein [Myxococcaceae bacterium]